MAQQGNLPQQRQRSAPTDGALNLLADAVKDITGSGDLLRSLMNNIVTDAEWIVRYVNPAFEKVTGYTKEEAVRGGAETILLAEDEEAIRNLAERSLRGYGYEVLVARDGAEAVALFEMHPEIAIALLDVVMPRMGGKEAFDAMRRSRTDLKVLFTSGYSTDRIHESFVLLPGIEFLPKPYGPASIARRVREVLDKI